MMKRKMSKQKLVCVFVFVILFVSVYCQASWKVICTSKIKISHEDQQGIKNTISRTMQQYYDPVFNTYNGSYELGQEAVFYVTVMDLKKNWVYVSMDIEGGDPGCGFLKKNRSGNWKFIIWGTIWPDDMKEGIPRFIQPDWMKSERR